MHIACKEGHINVIQCLLSQGADMTIKNIEGKTPLDGCCDTCKDEIDSLFSKHNQQGELISNKYVVFVLAWFVII